MYAQTMLCTVHYNHYMKLKLNYIKYDQLHLKLYITKYMNLIKIYDFYFKHFKCICVINEHQG
jgi:hypothetical protein